GCASRASRSYRDLRAVAARVEFLSRDLLTTVCRVAETFIAGALESAAESSLGVLLRAVAVDREFSRVALESSAPADGRSSSSLSTTFFTMGAKAFEVDPDV